MTVEELLLQAEELGIRLFVSGDRIGCIDPQGQLSEAMKLAIMEHKLLLLQRLPSRATVLGASRPEDGGPLRKGSVPALCRLPDPPDGEPVVVPASFSQARLWFVHQLDPSLTAYHLRRIWRLEGSKPIDPARLQSAINELVLRHESLRTAYRFEAEELKQIVLNEPVHTQVIELEGQPADRVLSRLWIEDRSLPFDLASGRMIRAWIVRESDCRLYLLISIHHIAVDGWSMRLIRRDLFELYAALLEGRSPVLPDLPLRYVDVACWQRQLLSGPVRQRLVDYWVDRLRGLEPLELPTDHPRPPRPSHRGGCVELRYGSALADQLTSLCRKTGCTLNMVLLAAVALILSRYSHQDDLGIAVPIWGRGRPELEDIVGFFVNTIIVRVRMEPQQTFGTLLRSVREASLEAYDHQDLPYDEVLQALKIERDVSRQILFQVILQVDSMPSMSASMPADPAIFPYSIDGDTGLLESSGDQQAISGSIFDLYFRFSRSEQGLAGTLVYAADLFSHERMERLGHHLGTLLEAVAEDPGRPLSQISLLPPSEQAQLLRWGLPGLTNPKQVCVPPRMAELLQLAAHRFGAQQAVRTLGRSITHAQLDRLANVLAERIRSVCIPPGPQLPADVVPILMDRSIALIVAMVACLKAGVPFLVLDPLLPTARHRAVLETLRVDLLLTCPATAAHPLAASYPTCTVDGDPGWSTPTEAATLRPESVPTADEALAYLIFTSGTTGVPKGVRIREASLVAFSRAVQEEYQLGPADTVLHFSSLSFDASIEEIFPALISGATVMLRSDAMLGDPSELMDAVRQASVSVLMLPTAYWVGLVEWCSQQDLKLPPSVRLVVIGGEAVQGAAVEQWFSLGHAATLINTYGPTEGTVNTTWHRITPQDAQRWPSVPIGRPLPYARVAVVDPAAQLCPIGVPGELWIGGDGLAASYTDPAATAEAFTPGLGAVPECGRLYRSGDLVAWNSDGSLSFHGRLDDQIKLRGYRIEPAEIAATLLRHPAVLQAVVVLRDGDPAGPRLVAYWQASSGVDLPPSASALRSFLAERLPHFMIPSAFVALERFPLTPTGKLDRRALPSPPAGAAAADRPQPATPLQRQLLALFVEVLGHEDVGIHDDFFSIGGHSMLTMQLKARVEQDLGRPMDLATFFASPTVEMLAMQLEPPSNAQDRSPADQARPDSTEMGVVAPAAMGLPASLEHFVERQLALLSRWPGTQPPGHRFVRTLHPGGVSDAPGLFWCFQGGEEFVALAQHLPRSVPVHGMRSGHLVDRDVYRNPALLHGVAALYAAEMLALQPTGPFRLGGNCQGALIANAIAWQLLAHGRQVARLILMEGSVASIQRGVLRWDAGEVVLLYGAQSHFNPFALDPTASVAGGRADTARRRKRFQKLLTAAFPMGYRVEVISGAHGQFWQAENLKDLAGAITRQLVSSGA